MTINMNGCEVGLVVLAALFEWDHVVNLCAAYPATPVATCVVPVDHTLRSALLLVA